MNATLDGLAVRDLDEAIGHCAGALDALRGKRLFVTGGTRFFGRWIAGGLARGWPDYRISAPVLTPEADSFSSP